MIAALIIWLCKKYIAPRIKKQKIALVLTGMMVFMLNYSPAGTFAQQSKYIIKHNDKAIGQLTFYQKQTRDDKFVKISSKVSTRFVFRINLETEDVAHFKDGKLINSSVKRTVNGKVKEPKITSWQNDHYRVNAGSKKAVIKQPINYNMMLLYDQEPIKAAKMYADSYQCFLPIVKVGSHHYRVNLPDGNFNEYWYENGICKTIVVNHSMYTIKMERA